MNENVNSQLRTFDSGQRHLCTETFAAPAGVPTDFGAGSVRRVCEHTSSLRATRAFVVTDAGLRKAGVVDRLVEPLTATGVVTEVFDEVPGNPTTVVVDDAARRLRDFAADVVIALGGGSSLDAAKGIALLAANPRSRADGSGHPETSPGTPLIAVPTTSGTGAETNGFGVLEDRAGGRKVYCGAESVVPRVAVLDPELTVGLPPGPTAATGVDALVHGIESLTSRGRNPLSELYATEAVSLANRWLPSAVEDGNDLEARSRMMFASHLAGLALTRSGLGLVHGLAHAISLQSGAAHGLALSSVLGPTVEFSLPADPSGYQRVTNAMGLSGSAALPDTLSELTTQVGTAVTLSELGCKNEQRAELISTALADRVTRNTPRTPSGSQVDALLQRCW